MTIAEADQYGWDVAGTLMPFIGLVAVILLALALMRLVTTW